MGKRLRPFRAEPFPDSLALFSAHMLPCSHNRIGTANDTCSARRRVNLITAQRNWVRWSGRTVGRFSLARVPVRAAEGVQDGESHNTARRPKGSPKAMVAVAAFAAFLATFNETYLNVAFSPVMADFGIDVNTVQWLATAYMLGAAVMVPVSAFAFRSVHTRMLFCASDAAARRRQRRRRARARSARQHRAGARHGYAHASG